MFIQKLIGFIVDTVKMIKGKPKATDVLMSLITKLPAMVVDAIGYGHATSKEQLDSALDGFDAYTGVDAGAVDVIKDLPPDKEEELCDHIKEAVRILGYNKLKLPGYFIEAQS